MDTPRTIVITGASRGIGRALVDHWVADGHTVFGCSRSAEAIAELRARIPAPHRFHAVDVSDGDRVAAWAAALPAPDLLVNNAAIMNRLAPLWEITEAEFNDMLQVNIAGTTNVIRAFVPRMIERGRGVIANLSSGWGRSTSPNVAPYCSTKWAIEGLTRALAQELPSGLAAVAVNPGIIDTDMLRRAWGDGASAHPSPAAWARRAAPFFLALSAGDNGQSASV